MGTEIQIRKFKNISVLTVVNLEKSGNFALLFKKIWARHYKFSLVRGCATGAQQHSFEIFFHS